LQAIEVLKEAISIGETHGYNDELERALKLMAESYVVQKDFESAYQYQSRYIKLHDSLESHKKEEQLGVAQAKFDSELKQIQIETLTQDAALQQEAYNRQRVLTYIALGFTTFLLFFLSLLWHNNKRLFTAKKAVDVLNRETRQQTALLRDSNATKDKLFSIISHDLRGPIGGLKSLMELISRHGLTQEEFVLVSQSIRKNIDSVYDDLDNLLQWAQTQLNGMKLNKEHFSFHSLAKDKMHLFHEVASSKGIVLENAVEEDFQVYADKNQMGLVLRNLIANAVKFSSVGGAIKVSATRDREQVTIEVSDRGVGMSAADLENLFQKDTHFTRRGTQNEKGIGLGLILTKEFVEANSGYISVRSELGKGTTFSIRFHHQPLIVLEPSLVA
jgi:signal transduction histidine kinase